MMVKMLVVVELREISAEEAAEELMGSRPKSSGHNSLLMLRQRETEAEGYGDRYSDGCSLYIDGP